MSLRSLAFSSLAAAALIAAPASADRLLVGGSAGTVFQTDASANQFQYFACGCGGPIQALTTDQEYLYTADSFGQILVYDRDDGVLQAIHAPSATPSTALTTGDGFLFAGDGNGLVLRIDPSTGDLLDWRAIPSGVQALLAHRGFLFAAGADGAVYRAPIDGGLFTYFTCFCFFNIQDLATDGLNLIIADQFGTVGIADLKTGVIHNAFWVGSLNAMVVQDGDLLVHSAGGVIDRRSLQDGSVLPGGYTSPIDINAMHIIPNETIEPYRARIPAPPK